MHASAVLLFAAVAVAQMTTSTTSAPGSTSSSGSTSGCGTQIDTIIAACLSSTQPQLEACPTNDWDCYCTQQTNVLTCYNNCMADPARNAAVSQQTAWCNAAHPFGTTSTPVAASATPSSSGQGSTGSSATPTTDASGSDNSATPSTSSDDAASSATENAAVANVVPGALAAFFGLAILL